MWDRVSESESLREGKSQGPTLPLYSLLLREVGWVCRLAEEQRRSSSAVSLWTLLSNKLHQRPWFRVSAGGTCPVSWHRGDCALSVTICPSSEPKDLVGEVGVLSGARFKFSGRHFHIDELLLITQA